jgi:hypothetical protein
VKDTFDCEQILIMLALASRSTFAPIPSESLRIAFISRCGTLYCLATSWEGNRGADPNMPALRTLASSRASTPFLYSFAVALVEWPRFSL